MKWHVDFICNIMSALNILDSGFLDYMHLACIGKYYSL